MTSNDTTTTGAPPEEADDTAESLAFWSIALALGPVAAVAIVGGYGFVVWMLQVFVGPPGT